jgi:hypothetical protein
MLVKRSIGIMGILNDSYDNIRFGLAAIGMFCG